MNLKRKIYEATLKQAPRVEFQMDSQWMFCVCINRILFNCSSLIMLAHNKLFFQNCNIPFRGLTDNDTFLKEFSRGWLFSHGSRPIFLKDVIKLLVSKKGCPTQNLTWYSQNSNYRTCVWQTVTEKSNNGFFESLTNSFYLTDSWSKKWKYNGLLVGVLTVVLKTIFKV